MVWGQFISMIRSRPVSGGLFSPSSSSPSELVVELVGELMRIGTARSSVSIYADNPFCLHSRICYPHVFS
jgi:hypothetical protein